MMGALCRSSIKGLVRVVSRGSSRSVSANPCSSHTHMCTLCTPATGIPHPNVQQACERGLRFPKKPQKPASLFINTARRPLRHPQAHWPVFLDFNQVFNHIYSSRPNSCISGQHTFGFRVCIYIGEYGCV